MINRNLSYFVYKRQILSKEECSQIIEWSEKNLDLEESTIGQNQTDKLIRKSKTNTIPDDSPCLDLLLQKFNQSFMEYCEEYLEDSYFISLQEATQDGYLFEPLQYTKYDKDDYYRWHTDQGSDIHSICRIVSFVLYLNDEFEGGGTEFPFETYKCNPGEVLIFPSNFLFPHCGQKVNSGTKRIITSWVNNLGVAQWQK
jgi:hypothetical protein